MMSTTNQAIGGLFFFVLMFFWIAIPWFHGRKMVEKTWSKSDKNISLEELQLEVVDIFGSRRKSAILDYKDINQELSEAEITKLCKRKFRIIRIIWSLTGVFIFFVGSIFL
jgi:hypothetical protein